MDRTSVNTPAIGPRAPAAAAVTVPRWASASVRGAGESFSPGALALGRLLAGPVTPLVIWAARGGLPPGAASPGVLAVGPLRFGGYLVR